MILERVELTAPTLDSKAYFICINVALDAS